MSYGFVDNVVPIGYAASMHNKSFSRLFAGIVTSAVWRRPAHVRVVWITLLALADKRGEVLASVPGLAAAANVSLGECREALDYLTSPDPDAGPQLLEGRHADIFPGGFRLTGFEVYRDFIRTEERREYLRVKQAEHRQRVGQKQPLVNTRQQMSTPPASISTPSVSGDVNTRQHLSTDVNKTGATPSSTSKMSAISTGKRGKQIEEYDQPFAIFWGHYPKKVGKGAAYDVWRTMTLLDKQLAVSAAAVFGDIWAKAPLDRRRFLVDPERWLKRKRWLDDSNEWRLQASDPGSGELTAANPAPKAPITKEELDLFKNADEEIESFKKRLGR